MCVCVFVWFARSAFLCDPQYFLFCFMFIFMIAVEMFVVAKLSTDMADKVDTIMSYVFAGTY